MGSGQADHTISVNIKHIIADIANNLPVEIKVAPTIDVIIESTDIPLQIDHRKIKGVTLKDPTVDESIPISIENDAIAYDATNDRFKVDIEAMTVGTIQVDVTDQTTRQLGIVYGDQGLPFAQEAVTGKLQCVVQ